MQGGREGRSREPIDVSKEDERAKKFAEHLAKLGQLERGEPEFLGDDGPFEDLTDLAEHSETSSEKGMAEPITLWPSKIGLIKIIESFFFGTVKPSQECGLMSSSLTAFLMRAAPEDGTCMTSRCSASFTTTGRSI